MDAIKAGLNSIFLIVALLLPGLVLLLMRRKERLAKGLLIAGIFLLCLFSFRPFSDFLLWGLESKYSPVMNFENLTKTKYIVVLTAWDSNVPTLPYTSNLGYRSAFRTLEAHRIYQKIPDCKIIISGSRNGGELMRKFLQLMKVPKKDILLDCAENTWNSGLDLKNLLRGQKFILVTSACHLPRSMYSFVREGLKPIPAPADYLYGYYPHYTFPFPRPLTYYLPHTDALIRTSAALYEYLGYIWYQIKYYE